jgi:hypothetical protein
MQGCRRLIKFSISFSIRDSSTFFESLIDFTKIKNWSSIRWYISFRTPSDLLIFDHSSNLERFTT